MTTVALLLALQMPSHVEAPPGDVGEVRGDFRGTEWELVSGRHPKAKVLLATISFVSKHELDIKFGLLCQDGYVSLHHRAYYTYSTGSQLPVIPPVEEVRGRTTRMNKGGEFRQQGGSLLLDIHLTNPFLTDLYPEGRLLLLLKQVK